MVYGTPPDQKEARRRLVPGGNLGGAGLGGGGIVDGRESPEPWMAGAVLRRRARFASLRFCSFPSRPPFRAPTGTGGSPTWPTTCGRSPARPGFLALLICFLPIGSGAVSVVVGGRRRRHASADIVALVTGVLGGIVSAIGCLVGGYLCDRLDRKTAYALYGLLQAVCAIAMVIAPRTEPMYIVFTNLRVHFGPDVRGILGRGARRDRTGRSRDQVQRVRVAVEHAHRVHDAGRRLGAYAVGTHGNAAKRSSDLHRRDPRIHGDRGCHQTASSGSDLTTRRMPSQH
jgi:hypothetical protein